MFFINMIKDKEKFLSIAPCKIIKLKEDFSSLLCDIDGVFNIDEEFLRGDVFKKVLEKIQEVEFSCIATLAIHIEFELSRCGESFFVDIYKEKFYEIFEVRIYYARAYIAFNDAMIVIIKSPEIKAAELYYVKFAFEDIKFVCKRFIILCDYMIDLLKDYHDKNTYKSILKEWVKKFCKISGNIYGQK